MIAQSLARARGAVKSIVLSSVVDTQTRRGEHLTEAEDLSQQKLRSYLLESIAQAADEIKEIDRQLTILKSQELEVDLLQSEKARRLIREKREIKDAIKNGPAKSMENSTKRRSAHKIG